LASLSWIRRHAQTGDLVCAGLGVELAAMTAHVTRSVARSYVPVTTGARAGSDRIDAFTTAIVSLGRR
jgi:hypothetical protein